MSNKSQCIVVPSQSKDLASCPRQLCGITLNMLSQYMARGQLPEHVLQHFEVSSVLIYENWNVVPNPPGYPHYQQVVQLRAREGRPDPDMVPNVDVEDDDNAVHPARGNRLTMQKHDYETLKPTVYKTNMMVMR